jgi:hypothetical protein
MEQELTEEFAFHVEMETKKLIAQGLSPAAAAQQARLSFGGPVAERERASRSGSGSS